MSYANHLFLIKFSSLSKKKSTFISSIGNLLYIYEFKKLHFFFSILVTYLIYFKNCIVVQKRVERLMLGKKSPL
jgi:tRNA1(Val) A37 N6-methylase TrmN6